MMIGQSIDQTASDGVQRIDVKPGLRLNLVDFNPRENFRVAFETDDAPLEFSYHLSGSAFYVITHRHGENSFKGKPGLNVVSTFPQSTGTMEFGAHHPVRMIAIHIDPSFFSVYLSEQPDIAVPELERVIQNGDFSYFYRPAAMPPSMLIAAGQMLDCPYRGLAGRLYYESKTLELMALQFAQLSSEIGDAARPSVLNGQDVERVRKAREILCEDPQNPPSLFHLASAVGMTHTKLNRGFKAVYGTTAFGYLRLHRLEESRRLLDGAEMNIAEIAYATGFSSPSHFAKAFLAHFGIRPSAYLGEVHRRRTISFSCS